VNTLKGRAIQLRRIGFSYSIICEKTGVSKSTLSNWLSRIPFEPNQVVIDKVGRAKLKSALWKQKEKFDSIKNAGKIAKKDVGLLSSRDLFILGIGIYMGEGEKTYEHVRIVNANPGIIKLAVRWFREACGVHMENFKPRLHTYPDNNIKRSILFWSNQTKIPVSQFGKTQVDRRLNKLRIKKGKLPYGTLHLHVNTYGSKNLGVDLHRKIMAWIDLCTKQI
jgi:transcriptional regulator with XRE-family HTH domain